MDSLTYCGGIAKYYRNDTKDNRIYICKEHYNKIKGDTLIANAPLKLRCEVTIETT